MSKPDHFIIAGTEKAGTTSIFSYLAGHPDVCPSRVKETNFFRLDNGGNYSDYLRHFSEGCQERRVLMEGSPGYLSESEKVCGPLQMMLPDARLLFILRNPVDRLVSSYRFHVGRLNIDETVSLDAYVEKCFSFHKGKATAQELGMGEWFLRTLEQGLYAQKLSCFLARFPAGQVKILFLDELKEDPGQVMRRVCAFLGIPDQYYENYRFVKENATFAGRNRLLHRMALAVNDSCEPFFRGNPRLKRGLLAFYKRWNGASAKGSGLSEENLGRLQEFYAPDMRELDSCLLESPQVVIPWLKWS